MIFYLYHFNVHKKSLSSQFYIHSQKKKSQFYIVMTQFVTISNWSWVRTLKAQTIKFVERGCSRTRLTFKSKKIQPHVYRWIRTDITICFTLKKVQFFGF